LFGRKHALAYAIEDLLFSVSGGVPGFSIATFKTL